MACYGIKKAKALWDYAKANYVDNGRITDFRELTNTLSDDLLRATGKRIVPEDIAKLLATPKTVRVAREKLLLTDYNRRAALNQARQFVAGTEKSPMARFIKTAYEAPYAAKVVGHGPALHMTHAWPYFFDPLMWRDFARTWVNAWKAMKPSNARAISESITLDPRFDQKVNSGLAVDPRKIYDDVNRRSGFWGKLGEMTSNGFIGLKQLRSAAWDSIYDTVPDHLKTKEMDQAISNYVNHMTGASPEVRVPEAVRAAMFAPSLDIARIKRVSDFTESAVRGAWQKSNPEQRFIARQNMKQWTRIAATYSALMYANQLMLKHFFGSKEDVNANNPFKGDWLAFKGPNGRVLQATGGQIPMIRAATRAVAEPKKAGSALGDYLMNKLNPALSIAKGIRTGESFGHEPLPFPLGKGEPTAGNWLTYATAELGPIATEDGIKEFSKRMSDQNGLSQDQNAKFLDAFWRAGVVTIPSAFGMHSYEPTKSKAQLSREAVGVP